MTRSFASRIALLIVASQLVGMAGSSGMAWSEEPAEEGDKLVSGMSIVGNDEAPKALAIVPWKGSDLGDTLDLMQNLDDGRGPVDKDVFMRGVDYYEIRAAAHDAIAKGPE